jgi:hypothetical protein
VTERQTLSRASTGAAVRLIGLPASDHVAATREEPVGSRHSGYVPSDALPDAARLLATVLRRSAGDSVVTLLRRDGRRIPVEWHAEVRGTRLHAWLRPAR